MPPRAYNLLAILLSIAAATAGASVFTSARQVEDRADAPRLAELVRQDCGSCHGLSLKGGLGGPLLPEDLAHYEPDILADVILDGIPGTAMPGWRGIVDQQEADWIANALKEGSIK